MRVVRAQAALGSPWGPFTAGELMGVPDAEGERILDVAMECFVGFGVRQTSVELIARRAGLSRPTVYKRFPGRDGVARALFVREARRFLSAVADTARAAPSKTDGLHKGMEEAFFRLTGHPLLRALIANDGRDVLPYLTTDAEHVLDAAVRLAVPFLRAWLPDEMTAHQAHVAAEFLGRFLISHLLTPTATPRDVTALCAGAVAGARAAARALP